MILDSSMLQFLFAPFVASLILTGIHSYLGVHVVQRGVIFVDLSLAQIAAFGGTIAQLLLDRGLGCAAVVIDSAQVRGVRRSNSSRPTA